MTRPGGWIASAIVRGWTRVYTWRLPLHVREARRAEIESDLWEFAQDEARRRAVSPELHVLARLVGGVPHDLAWTADQHRRHDAPHPHVRLAGVAALSVVVAVCGAFWLVPLVWSDALPPAAGARLAVVPPPTICPPPEAGAVSPPLDRARVGKSGQPGN